MYGIENECYNILLEIWDIINDDISDIECFDRIVAVFVELGHTEKYKNIFKLT